jgi:hypothetical protein
MLFGVGVPNSSSRRVVILGRGAAGKSTAARRLAAALGCELIELDAHFWSADLVATPPDRWCTVQEGLGQRPCWVMDGDLGPYDVLEPRLRAADEIWLLDFPVALCLGRALRRSRERWDFWRWMLTWRHTHKPAILSQITHFAPATRVRHFRRPGDLEDILAALENR